MSKLLDAIDRYKFGLLAVLATYIVIFMYLQMESYTQYTPIEPFHDGSYVQVPDEDIKLKPENIQVPSDYSSDVKNMARDANDDRERSNEKYYQNKSSEQIMADYKELEQQMYDEAGGDKTRAQIQAELEQKRKELDAKKTSDNKKPSQEGGDVAYAGNVMVDWSLPSRNAHQKNNWYVRNPGYTCGYGSAGRVTVMIKVNQNGSVTVAEYDPAQSSGANACMIEQAIKYAKLSRFDYSGSAPKIQQGRITYTFVAQ